VLVGLLILLKSVPEWAAFFDKYALAMLVLIIPAALAYRITFEILMRVLPPN